MNPPEQPAPCPGARWVQKANYLSYALAAVVQNQFDATTFYTDEVGLHAALAAGPFMQSLPTLSTGCARPRHCYRPLLSADSQPPALPAPAPPVQGVPVPGSSLVPSSIQTGLSLEGNMLVLFGITVGTRLLAYASIEAAALLKFI